MSKKLSVCFVGLGSIGKRHLRNLHFICRARGWQLEVDALRHDRTSTDDDFAGLIRRQFFSIEELHVVYDIIFICNPSQLHYETIIKLRGKANAFFVEKPAFVCPMERLIVDEIMQSGKYYVACPLRHTRVFSALRDYVLCHPVYSVRSIFSSYLPNWRPGADYRMLYSAQKESGGVKLDLIHEFDYLYGIFGEPLDSVLFEGKYSNLEIESNDLLAFVAKYRDKVVELHLDYFGRKVQRYCEVFSSEETMRFNFAESRVENLRTGEIVDLSEDRDEYQRRELSYYLDFACGDSTNINTLLQANALLQLLDRSKRS